MNITEARIDHLSNLARLSLPGGEKEEIARELERILDYMAVLDGLDTAGTEPLSHVFPLKNVLRPDETAPSADRAALLAGAPASRAARSAEGAVSSGRRTFFSGKTWLSGSVPAVSRPSSTAM